MKCVNGFVILCFVVVLFGAVKWQGSYCDCFLFAGYVLVMTTSDTAGDNKVVSVMTSQVQWVISALTHWPLGDLDFSHFKTTIFNLVLLIGIFTSSKDYALRWMPKDLSDDKSTLV